MEMRGVTAVFADCVKKLKCWHAFRRIQINLIQTWCDDRYYRILHFHFNPVDIYLDSRSQECKN